VFLEVARNAAPLAPHWLQFASVLTFLFAAGPALYGLYAALCVAPRSRILISIAITSHAALILIVAYLRST
jgi:hypothetical protein